MKNLSDKLLLYAITAQSCLKDKSLKEAVESAIEAGATAVQLRLKGLERKELLEQASVLKEICKKKDIIFIINDYVWLAKEVDADGVHLGLEDGNILEARKILGKDKIIGASAHNVSEAVKAQKSGADYLGCGAVFSTDSKDNVSVLKIEELKKICEAVKVPVVAIGGINKDNIKLLESSGISGVAVIGALFSGKDIKENARELKDLALKYIK